MNLEWLKPYTQMYGVLIQVGSDAYMYCNFLTHSLLHNVGVKTFIVYFFKIVYLSLKFLGKFFLSCLEGEGYSNLPSD